MSDINDRFKSIRLETKLNQQKFGDKLRISQNHISSLESGRRTITTRIIKDICREFNINENWFITGKGDKFNTNKYKKDKENNISNNIENLTEALADISLSDNNKLHELIISLSKMNKNQINIMCDISRQLPSKPLDDRILQLMSRYIHSLLKDQ